MPRPRRETRSGASYHVWTRGNRKQDIFVDDEDRRFLLNRLRTISMGESCVVWAFCLMSNHLHLALRPGAGPLWRVMHRLLHSYAQWFNKRHGLVGHVFQSRYGSRLLEGAEELVGVIKYIHRNPVEACLVDRAEDWRWSSDHIYRGAPGPGAPIVDAEQALRLFSTSDSVALALYEDLIAGSTTVSADLGAPGKDSTAFASHIHHTRSRLSDEECKAICNSIAAQFHVPIEALLGRGNPRHLRPARSALARELVREYGWAQVEVAAKFSWSASSVSRWLR